MKIPLKVEYACRVMAQLARCHGRSEWPHIEQLAAAEAIPANYLVQILNDLRTNGLVNSRRGKQGGYQLARPPEDITLADIIRAIDGDLLTSSTNPEGASGAQIARIWDRLALAFAEQANVITVESIIRGDGSGMYHI